MFLILSTVFECKHLAVQIVAYMSSATAGMRMEHSLRNVRQMLRVLTKMASNNVLAQPSSALFFSWVMKKQMLRFHVNGSVAIGKPERHVRKASHCGSK